MPDHFFQGKMGSLSPLAIVDMVLLTSFVVFVSALERMDDTFSLHGDSRSVIRPSNSF